MDWRLNGIKMLPALVILSSFTFLTGAAKKDYFQIYLDRKFRLLKPEESMEPKSACFITRFPIGPLKNTYYAYDETTAEENAIANKWLHKKGTERLPKLTVDIECSSDEHEFFLNYKLPEGIEEGAEIDRLDQNVYMQRKHFYMNFPESCNDMEKFGRYTSTLVKKFYFHKMEFINGEHWVTVEDCIPLTTMADFSAGYAGTRQTKSWVLTEEQQYYGSTDTSIDYFGQYLERKVKVREEKDNSSNFGACFLSNVRVLSPRYMQYVYGLMSEVQHKRYADWSENEMKRRQPNVTAEGAACKFETFAFALDYALSERAGNFEEVLDYFDLKMWLRLTLWTEDDRVCKDKEKYYELETQVHRPKYAITKLEKSEDGKSYDVEVRECYQNSYEFMKFAIKAYREEKLRKTDEEELDFKSEL